MTLKAFANLGANLRFGFPAMIAVFCEWGAFDVFQFLAGAIGDLQLATMSVVFTVQFFLFQAAFSMGQASTVRIGNLLGANQPLQARVTLRVLFLCSSAVALACLAVLLPSGEFIGRMMTSDEAVVKEFKCILPWLCASQVADSKHNSSYLVQGAFFTTLGSIPGCILGAIQSNWTPVSGCCYHDYFFLAVRNPLRLGACLCKASRASGLVPRISSRTCDFCCGRGRTWGFLDRLRTRGRECPEA